MLKTAEPFIMAGVFGEVSSMEEKVVSLRF